MFWNKDNKGSEDSGERELKELKKQIESKREGGDVPQSSEEPKPPMPAAKQDQTGKQQGKVKPPQTSQNREQNSQTPSQSQGRHKPPQRPQSQEPQEQNSQTSNQSQQMGTQNLGKKVTGPLPERKKSDVEAPASAPLFIKIDRYKEVLEQLGEIRKTLNSLKKLLNLLVNIDDLKGNTMDTFKGAISDVTNSLISLDEQFIRPEGAEEIVPDEEPQSEVEDYMTDLRSELSDLRRELDKIE